MRIRRKCAGFCFVLIRECSKCGKLGQGGRLCITLRAYLAQALDGSVKLFPYLKGFLFANIAVQWIVSWHGIKLTTLLGEVFSPVSGVMKLLPEIFQA